MEPGPERSRREGFGLRWALAISVILHLLLVLVAGWVPLVPSPSAALEPEANSIRFSFAPREDAPAEGEQLGEIPLPLPATDPAELMPPEPPAEEVPAETWPEETELPPIERPDVGQGQAPDPADAASAPAFRPPADAGPLERFDLSRALQDFQRAIDHSRSQPSGPPPQVGKQLFLPQSIDLPMPGVATGIVEFESRDYDWSDYGQQVHDAILRAWYLRIYRTVSDFERWAQANRWVLDDENRVRFVIERRGNVSGITLKVPSGVAPLDDSAIDALSQVVLPPLPADFPRDQEVVKARFIAKIPIYTTSRYEFTNVGGRYVLWDTARGRVVSDHPSAQPSTQTRSFLREYLRALKRLGIF